MVSIGPWIKLKLVIHFLDCIYIHKLNFVIVGFCCEWYLCIDVFQQAMSDETELAIEPEKQMELCGEPSPSASKEKLSVDLLSEPNRKRKESPIPGTSSESMEDDKDDCSHLLFMILPS